MYHYISILQFHHYHSQKFCHWKEGKNSADKTKHEASVFQSGVVRLNLQLHLQDIIDNIHFINFAIDEKYSIYTTYACAEWYIVSWNTF